MPYGPTNTGATAMMPADVVANLPMGDNISTALAYSDAFWIENYDALKERWSSWVVQ
jgi:putative spermidine/putrescine transport system substrate-binding protein